MKYSITVVLMLFLAVTVTVVAQGKTSNQVSLQQFSNAHSPMPYRNLVQDS